MMMTMIIIKMLRSFTILSMMMTIIIIKMLRSLTMIILDDDFHYHQEVEKFDND